MATKKEQTSITSNNPMVGTKIKPVPKPQKEIGIDTTNTFIDNVVEQSVASSVDISRLESFSTVTQTREQVYKLIDTMAEDPILSSFLKTIAEDSVETNDNGQVVWCESNDSNCAKYVTFLLDSLNVDKNAYKWIYSLYKYGDVYLRLYRESDYEQDKLFKDTAAIKDREKLTESRFSDAERQEKYGNEVTESVNVILHESNDHYVHYVEMVHNPGEIFELTKFGKTMGYIRAPINLQNTRSSGIGAYSSSFMMYRMKQSDVEVYSATDFVHGCLEDNSSRIPEEVDIFSNADDYDRDDASKAYSYTVKRGQSELSSVFKIWRQLSLLENSALLNRITKSSIIRTIQVEVGDMPKEQVGAHLNAIKNLMEQKTAINADTSYSEYNNPGPIENNIYIPTRNSQGAITAGQIGGDFDPKQLTDINYFQDKLFGALGVPKAFFGVTSDGAGFNGGTSLAIQSSRYGKSVKRVQNTFCQMITDLINLLLLDKGLSTYVNKFTIRMQDPVTQEELDRRENKKNRIGVVQDIMTQLSDVPNQIIKLKILKSLLSSSINDITVLELLQTQIDELESENEAAENTDAAEGDSGDAGKNAPKTHDVPEPPMPSIPARMPSRAEHNEPLADGDAVAPKESDERESSLPTPNELDIDFTDNTKF